MSTDYLSDAPDYNAWAGAGPHAQDIYDLDAAEGTTARIDAFRSAVNARVARLVGDGMDVADALAAYDPEALAEVVLGR